MSAKDQNTNRDFTIENTNAIDRRYLEEPWFYRLTLANTTNMGYFPIDAYFSFTIEYVSARLRLRKLVEMSFFKLTIKTT